MRGVGICLSPFVSVKNARTLYKTALCMSWHWSGPAWSRLWSAEHLCGLVQTVVSCICRDTFEGLGNRIPKSEMAGGDLGRRSARALNPNPNP